MNISLRLAFALSTCFLLLNLQGYCDTPDETHEKKITYVADTVTIKSDGWPVSFKDTNRTVEIIDHQQIEEAPVHSVQELLSWVGGVDVRERGPLGVQADLSIYGATFEETLILLDGIPVTDPQTGHNTLDIPVNLIDIDRIEVLKGSASSLYGPKAFGGVINIITRKASRNQVVINMGTGEHGLGTAGVSAGLSLKKVSTRISGSLARSDGYRPGTDFCKNIFSLSGIVSTDSGTLNFSTGVIDKKFGANGFYTESFPGAFEHTQATIYTAAGDFEKGRFHFSPKVYWRNHSDEFLLDRQDPLFYRNYHLTDNRGVILQETVDLDRLLLVFGGSFGEESIDSNRLGDHERKKSGLFIQGRTAITERFNFVAGAYAYHYSGWGTKVWPGVDAGYQITPSLRLYASATRCFRVPTYTELYYEDPVSLGNPDLEPEEAWNYETGLRWDRKDLRGSASVVRRNGTRLIDWVRVQPENRWKAANISSTESTGIDVQTSWYPRVSYPQSPLSAVNVNCYWMDQKHGSGNFESRYVLDTLRYQVMFSAVCSISHNTRLDFRSRTEERLGGEPHTLLDAKYSWNNGNLSLFVQVTNILDTRHTEIGYAPMPGRWLSCGISLSFPKLKTAH